jgi:hypothetical protein
MSSYHLNKEIKDQRFLLLVKFLHNPRDSHLRLQHRMQLLLRRRGSKERGMLLSRRRKKGKNVSS